MRTPAITNFQAKHLRNERAWGSSYRQIAAHFHLPKSTVYDHTRAVKVHKAAARRAA